MENNKQISIAVIRRLPRYLRYLKELLDKDIERISSKELSISMNITASQIRQDLNNFGCFGQQGYGYNVESLYLEIKKLLGLFRTYNLIIIGAGNIGQALINYENFALQGFRIIGIFDVNPKIIGFSFKGNEVRDMDTLGEFIDENEIDIAVLTLPKSKTLEVAKFLSEKNVKGIWNFSNLDIQDIKNTKIENVHLSDSLMTLSYKLNE